jgi:hypothetical protein
MADGQIWLSWNGDTIDARYLFFSRCSSVPPVHDFDRPFDCGTVSAVRRDTELPHGVLMASEQRPRGKRKQNEQINEPATGIGPRDEDFCTG